MRSIEQLDHYCRYIRYNPVKAELKAGQYRIGMGVQIGAESSTGSPVDLDSSTGNFSAKQDNTDVPPATTGETPVPHLSRKYSDFRRILEQTQGHPNRRYFILKSIIIGNLFGVDIMEEAVEICKLRTLPEVGGSG